MFNVGDTVVVYNDKSLFSNSTYRFDVIKSITINANRFDFEPEITAKILKKKQAWITQLPEANI